MCSGRDWRQALGAFVAETDRALDLFSGFMPEVRPLDDAETLTFLHGTISERRHEVAVPETPIYLDGLLADTPLHRRARADARRHASAHAHHPRLPEPEPARDPRRAQSPGFRLSLGHAVHRARQDRRLEGADEAPPAMVQQAQVDHRDAARGDLQPARPAARQRRRQQGGRRRSRAAGAGRRPCRLRLSDHDDHRLRYEPRAGRGEGPRGRADRQRARLHLHPRNA